MRQSRAASLVEAGVNTAAGFAVALGIQLAVFPLSGLQVALSGNLAIAAIFTVASVVRGYALRRVFEALRVRQERKRRPRGRERRPDGTIASAGNSVDPATALGGLAHNVEAEALVQGARDRAPDGVGLPAGCLSDLGNGRALPCLQHADQIGVLTQVHRAALAAYCQAWGRWVEAEKKLAETPALLKTPAGYV